MIKTTLHLLFCDIINKNNKILSKEQHISSAVAWLKRAQDVGINNGVSAGYFSSSNTLELGSSPLYIGKQGQDVEAYFNGYMDEVRIWNIARTQSQIANNMNNTLASDEDNLVAYYNFDHGIPYADNSGVTQLVDVSSLSNHGTLQGFTLNGSGSNWSVSSPYN